MGGVFFGLGRLMGMNRGKKGIKKCLHRLRKQSVNQPTTYNFCNFFQKRHNNPPQNTLQNDVHQGHPCPRPGRRSRHGRRHARRASQRSRARKAWPLRCDLRPKHGRTDVFAGNELLRPQMPICVRSAVGTLQFVGHLCL